MDIQFHLINGKPVPVAEATVPVTDLGLLRGYAIFDYFRVKNFRAIFVRDHVERFARSAERLNMKFPGSLTGLVDDIHRLVQLNKIPDAGIRLVLTGGNSPDGFSPAPTPNLLILQHPYPHYPEHLYTEGGSMLLDEFTRDFPTIKTTNYANAVAQLDRMQSAGAADILYHENGRIFETTRANFFIVREDGMVQTRTSEVLRGITQKHVLQLAAQHYEVLDHPISLPELRTASEAFVTGSGKKIMPIVRIGTEQIGNGKPGPVTRHLMQLFDELTEQVITETARPQREDVLDWL